MSRYIRVMEDSSYKPHNYMELQMNFELEATIEWQAWNPTLGEHA